MSQSVTSMHSLLRIVLAGAACALLLGGCGQKGPLYLPNAQKAPVLPSAGAATPSVVPAEATPLVNPANPSNPANPGTTGGAPGAPSSQTPQQQQQQRQAPQSQPAQPNDSQSTPDGSPSAGGNSPAA